jgi:hypothetical protein
MRPEVASMEEIWKDFPKYIEKSKVKEMCRTLREDPKRRLFAYTNLDDKYGMLMEDYEELKPLLESHDQKAYDSLMAIVAENREMETQLLWLRHK